MIPAWKVRREVGRLGQHLRAQYGLIYEPILKIRHDRWRRAQPVPPDGSVPLGAKVAVFLLFQPRGLAPSTFLTLRHLVEKGYAPLVVSNAPLSAQDLAALQAVSWRVIERPNFGYDFGGYRDGILLLEAWGIAPERLLILNDSIWMPLAPNSTLIDRFEAAEGAVIGGILHPDKVRRRVVKRVRRGFVESYLYLINRPALGSVAFHTYWEKYRVSSNKFNAVKNGERGFSRSMRDSGFDVTGLFSPASLIAALEASDNETLHRSLHYGVYTESALAAEGAALLGKVADETWRNDALNHIRRTIERRRFNASFPYPSIRLLGMDFMKRSTGAKGAGAQSLHVLMRRCYVDAVNAGDLPAPFPDVSVEILDSICIKGT